MRRTVAGLGLAALLISAWGVAPARAATTQTVKPYIVLILDVSGSMADANGCSTATAANCNCDSSTGTGTCFTPNGDDFEVLVPIVANNQPQILLWNNFVCTTCGPGSGDPELFAIGSTPIASSLVGDKLYWQGLPSPSNGAYWTGAGADPIRNDPLKL